MFVFGKKLFCFFKVVVFGQKWLYCGKSGCIRTKAVVFEQKWLYSGNVIVFGKSVGIRAKVLIFQ